MVERAILDSIHSYLEAVQQSGIHARKAILYGSQVRGDAHQWSDIDLIIIAPEFDERRDSEIVDILWKLRARTDSRIQPIACGEREWIEDQERPIIEIARQEGILIEPEPQRAGSPQP